MVTTSRISASGALMKLQYRYFPGKWRWNGPGVRSCVQRASRCTQDLTPGLEQRRSRAVEQNDRLARARAHEGSGRCSVGARSERAPDRIGLLRTGHEEDD